MTGGIPPWLEAIVAALLVLSGLFVLVSAVGFVRLKDFFVRMHPPALAYTGGTWSVTLAGILYFSALEKRAALHPWLIMIVLAMAVPVTSLLLARVVLFRRRAAGSPDTPPPLSERQSPEGAGGTTSTSHFA
jgi:multicomponent K+:H+ antiporter subunit G